MQLVLGVTTVSPTLKRLLEGLLRGSAERVMVLLGKTLSKEQFCLPEACMGPKRALMSVGISGGTYVFKLQRVN